MNAIHPTFSIIVPVFKTPLDYVQQAFESVRAQTLASECELVVWDDGSPVTYKREIRRLISLLQGIRVIYGEYENNQGLCHARNSAIDLATGEWLLLLDADDLLDRCILEQVKPAFVPGVELVYTDHILVSSDGSRIIHERAKAVYQHLHGQFKGSIHDPMFQATFIFHCQIFRRATFLQLGKFRIDLGSGEEVDLHLRISELSSSVNYRHVPGYYYIYRDNPESVCHDNEYYSKLISNISQILVESAHRQGYPIYEAKRIGRSSNTHAAHYLLTSTGGQDIYSPWFDYEKCAIRSEFFIK
jgi:glycosyltransferase involved in cell wall biosynthesis